MTQNEIAYWKYKEDARHNKASEYETSRHNLAAEKQNQLVYAETSRHNQALELLTSQKQAEERRANLARESETTRHNVAMEEESYRHNYAVEQETARYDEWSAGLEWANINMRDERSRESNAIAKQQADAASANAETNRIGAHRGWADTIIKGVDVFGGIINDAFSNTIKAVSSILPIIAG